DFMDSQWDMHLSGSVHDVLSPVVCVPDMPAADFRQIGPEVEAGQAETPDENDVLLHKAAGLGGGVRVGEE
ncbi:phage tail assembly protein T, partial [Escherichia coli]|uniref:phage tail assembly protein T n=1 Tax=Escherichia coli TaxID=562 RepID=UPI000B3F1CA9